MVRLPKKKLESGILNILSTYNNTIISLSDPEGRVVLSSSSGAMGFKGARKGTPYAASKVADFMAERAKLIGLKEVGIKVKGIGAGRESAIRTFAARGFDIQSIRDLTPTPHNGPKPPKPRRV
ncbi:30S ribosomal protein S11 [Candidatus Giovannonibacteria bacterium RIFCSPHIGHO2_01_FULL_48_47]|nr:MAG: 30S ribosomal protein S11 [Candidatus Giovannonibacteria bacterium RIFCSPHIGHO2_01_FULL_48_47]OGF67950.1 MAG: 30S ribosomal protein S11 [Candidatus Giovannonibacteria bacterium RIFCSPHIGHO2_02_FULL_48_15]OGF88152.1 MAG: 30S ribosomal protein S11 [Candidatus Giovannonibacteria bacterium RIFCSPLOWO2_01_FULL_48_47]OGF94936.1 MAG: 30S ribosomal protein S11 [Candidatus Giovannonibacteria bacterium RIFOXYC1_FULL_48_8]OGF96220.1 MAG: 30S ribosomal protein S11 [Candidatus Giovannonibacteria bac